VESSPKKIRKKRKPMTPEQRAAAAERLAKAREKKLKNNPPKNVSLHESIRDLPDDHTLHPKKVKEWIKTQKDLRAAYKREVRTNVKGALAKYMSCDSYIKNMERYLRNGEWSDLFYGEHQQNRMKWSCVALAYHHTGKYAGMAKRSVGVYYPDLGMEWTKELNDDYYK